MKQNIIIFIVFVLVLSSCNKESNGPYIEIYKFRGDYANLVPVLISKNDTLKIGGYPIYDNYYIQMPIKFHNGYYADGTNGISAMRTIQQTLNIPAIYISGNSDNKTMDDAEKTNMKAFLVKPVTQDEIAKAIV